MRPASARRLGAWLAVLVLASVPVLLRGERPAPDPSPYRRLLGPIASLAASVQWVRVDQAFSAGRIDLALARADTALALDPGSTEGWMFLARGLGYDKASVAREPDPARRRAWLEAALDVVERGLTRARHPEELHLWRAILLYRVAYTDPDTEWPGGTAALFLEAEASARRAEAMGQPDAGPIAGRARQELLKLDD